MKDETVKGNDNKLLKRIILLVIVSFFGLRLPAQIFNEFRIPEDLLKANRVRAVRQDFINRNPLVKPQYNVYTYNNEGKLEQVEYFIDQEPKAHEFYRYDSAGKLVEKIQRANDFKTWSLVFNSVIELTDETKWEYQYDSSSQLLQSIIHKSKKGTQRIDSVFYLPNKFISTSYFSNGRLCLRTKQYYDKFDNVIEEQDQSFLADSSKVTCKMINKYNANKSLIKTTVVNGLEPFKYDYEYYYNGLLKSKSCKTWRNSFTLTYRVY
ncbi:MAG: hypothetical protein V4722_16845 [Bacteroidota bacterium]